MCRRGFTSLFVCQRGVKKKYFFLLFPLHFFGRGHFSFKAYDVPCFRRCLWKCPAENSPTASFPFSPSLKCPQSCRLLACAAAEPHLCLPAPEKPHRLLSAAACPVTHHQGVECTEAFLPAGSCGLQGMCSTSAVPGARTFKSNSPHLDFVSAQMALLGFQLHEIQTDQPPALTV